MKTSVIAATMNEIDGVRAVLPRIPREAVHEIIIVDLNSSDGTVAFCESQPGVRVIHQQTKGYAHAMQEGIAAASGDILIEFQPDGNSLPEKIPELIAKIHEGYDLVIASRHLPGAKSYDDDPVTALGNRVFTKLVNWCFHMRITDVLIGYRAFRRDAFAQLSIDASGLEWAIQLPIQFKKHGFRIAEIPADEPKRIGGVRKMRPFRTGLRILGIFLKEMIRP